MNHNLSQFREIIKDCIDGEPVNHRNQSKLEAVLEMLPEEDTDHVKAYRSLMFLIEYLEDYDYEEPDQFGNPDPVHQLLSLRPEIQDKAQKDVIQRIEINEKPESGFGLGPAMKIKDPVSKIHQNITKEQKQHDLVEKNVDHLSRTVLEAPL
jgi:hypothetical protein